MTAARRNALTAAVALAVAALAFYLSGWPGRTPQQLPSEPGRVQRFDREPRITLYDHRSRTRTTLPMEQYVAGVVAGEMWENWPQAAYAAQAILARTFTLDFLAQGGLRQAYGADISTDPEEAQAYNPANITPVIRRAVDSTRGQVLTYGGRYARAWFHAYSGGETTTPQEGLGMSGPQPPYLRPVRLPENPLVPQQFRHWRAEFSTEEVARALARRGVDVGDIQRVQIAARGPTGRITEVEVAGSRGVRRISGNDLRVALGPDRMRSTLVNTFQLRNGRLVVEGTGSGHGVGLSQWDALLLARQGKSPQQIVATFYPGAKIEKLWR
ncbi:MAG TPA: SpoIID/LytB domain-containing protein [Limnochordales bacterium]